MRRLHLFPLLLLLLALAAAGPARAVERADLKAAIVYNLLAFVDWPAEAAPPQGGNLVLCIDPASPLAAPLRTLVGRPVRSHRLELHELAAGESARRCHALFIDAVARSATLTMRRQLKGAPVLVIGDEPVASDDAIAIYLEESAGRIAFEVDMAPVRQSRLQLSSRLLKLARRVN